MEIDCTNDISACISLKKIKEMTDLYNKWMNTDDKKDIYSLINTDTDTDGSIKLLNNFHHLIHKHNDDASFEYICRILSDDKCTAAKCSLMTRNNRVRNETNTTQIRKDLYYGFSDSKNVDMIQTLDKIHCHFCHSFEMGMRLTLKEKAIIQEAAVNKPLDNYDDLAAYQSAVYGNQQLILQNEKKDNELEGISLNDPSLTTTLKILRQKRNNLIKVRGINRVENNKFNTVIQQNTEEEENKTNVIGIDELYEYLTNQGVTYDNMKTFDTFIKDEEYDTEAIEQDTETAESSNIMNNINIEQYDKITVYLHPVIDSQYSFGMKFYYDKKHKDIDGIIPAVNGGNGQCICDWWVAPKYESIKDELLNNVTICIQKDEYDDLVQKSANHYESDHCKTHYRNRQVYWDWPLRGWQFTDNFSRDHILSAMVYCNFTKLQYEYSKTYRKIPITETDDSIKNRHSHFAHLARLLTESCYMYGTLANPKSGTHTFWHGINCKLIFNKCVAVFVGPTSTSCSREVTINFAKDKGVLIQLHCGYADAPDNYVTFLDCRWMTDFVYEEERLFIGQSMALEFKTIITTIDNTNYEIWIYTLSVVNVLFCDMNLNVAKDRPNWFQHQIEKTKKVHMKKLVLKVLHHELHKSLPEKYKKANYIPEYIDELLHQYFVSKDDMQIEWFNDQYDTYPACRIMKRFFRSSFLCIDTGAESNSQWMNLPLFCVLFPKLKQIKIKLNREDGLSASKIPEHFVEYMSSQLSDINNTGSQLEKVVFWFHENKSEELNAYKSKYISKYETFGWTLEDKPFEMIENSFIIRKA
eukprot:438740_1